jgi:signal peptidase I
LAGFGKVKNNDVVVFHFPEGDTVALGVPTQSYYQLVRSYGRNRVWTDKRNFGDIIARPVDKRENYIKRCVGIPGDEIKIVESQLFVNGQPQEKFPGVQYDYVIQTNGTSINPKALDKLHISEADRNMLSSQQYYLPLTDNAMKEIEGFANVVSVTKTLEEPAKWEPAIFPSDSRYPWNVDNFGPLKIPAKGTTVQLNVANLPLYRRIIEIYENNDLEVDGDVIKINGEVATSYTFKMDYYWMMGDNRHNSADSRYWGFVPEDHVVGKASFIWLSLDKDRKFPANIRFKRMFSFVK